MTHRELDIEDFVAVSAFYKAIRPDYVLHCAAISNTGTCEKKSGPLREGQCKGNHQPGQGMQERRQPYDILPVSDQIYNTSHSMEPNREGSERESREMCMEETRNGRRKPCLTYLPDAVASGLLGCMTLRPGKSGGPGAFCRSWRTR